MTISDPIADMLTRIRNASKAKFSTVDIPGSILKSEIASVLKDEGYIKNFKFIKDGKQGIIRIYLKYGKDQSPAIMQIQRISHPSRRLYIQNKEIKPIYSGTGIAIITTSKGVMSDRKARKDKVGGEILCKVW